MENLNQELISRDKELSAYKLQAQEYSLQIEGAITQMENLNQELISRDKELMDLRKQSKVKGSNDE